MFAVVGLAEHPSCGVHRVAHQGVRPPVRAAEEPGEHGACLDTLADHERTVGRSDRERSLEECVGRVPWADWSTGTEHELDAIAGNIGVQHRDAEVVACGDDLVDQLPEGFGHAHRPEAIELLGDADHHDEANRDESVFAAEIGEGRELFDDCSRNVRSSS